MESTLFENVGFNPAEPTVMHIDLNSCFASVEQQANPKLRGKPIAVAAYESPGGCILAPSIEAKQYGVKTGMRVAEGKDLCPHLLILPSDPDKYRFINRKFLYLFHFYSDQVQVKSIDEMQLLMEHTPALKNRRRTGMTVHEAMSDIGKEIKTRIKQEIGDWLQVSIGVSTNRYLAKVAAGLHKPNGLDFIDRNNILDILSGFELEDLPWIKYGNGSRLRCFNIRTAVDFYNASGDTLRKAFNSIIGGYWWRKLHGYSDPHDEEFGRKSFGHSYALRISYQPNDVRLIQILCQLSEKMGRRLRLNKFIAQGIHLSCLLDNHTFWHEGHKLQQPFFASDDLYKAALAVLKRCPMVPVRTIAVSCHYLTDARYDQLKILEDSTRKRNLYIALDKIHDRWGGGKIYPGRMLGMPNKILDRISFGNVKQLEEFLFQEEVTAIEDFI